MSKSNDLRRNEITKIILAKEKVRVEEFRFTGNRSKNRDYAVVRALTLLREELI